MRSAVREPNVEIGIWIGVKTCQSQNASVVFPGLCHAIDQRTELQRNDLNVNAQFLQIVLDNGGHLRAAGIGGMCQDRKSPGLAGEIKQPRLAVRAALPGKASLFEECTRLLKRP